MNKKHLIFALILGIFLCAGALAQTDLVGTWQGKLAISPNEKLTIQFKITRQAGGAYSVVLDSPDTGGIKNVAASGVKLANNILAVEVASLSGSFSGTVSKGAITGEWKQAGSAFPLVLTPYTKPSVSTLQPLIGEWVGELIPPDNSKMTVVLHFQMSNDKKFTGSADIPAQGQSGIPISDVVLEGNEVAFKIAGGQANYSGKLAGNKIEGAIKQGTQNMTLNVTRGKYENPGFALSPEDAKRLQGIWLGRYGQGGPDHTVVWTFDKRTDGKLKGTAAAPEASVQVLPIMELSLKGDQLTLKIPGAGAEFTGKLSEAGLSGTFKARGQELTLSFKRGTAADLPTTQMDLPADMLAKLMGRWKGTLGPESVVLRFEKGAGAKPAAHMDFASRKNMLVVKAILAGENLALTIPGGEDINLKLNGNKLEGNLKPKNQAVIPVVLTKQP